MIPLRLRRKLKLGFFEFVWFAFTVVVAQALSSIYVGALAATLGRFALPVLFPDVLSALSLFLVRPRRGKINRDLCDVLAQGKVNHGARLAFR
jgi:hypothetical protein